MRAVVHIGTEKTGTSAIQQLLSAQRSILRSKGILVPRSPGLRNHRWLAAASMNEDHWDDFFKSKGISDSETRREAAAQFITEFGEELRSARSDCDTVVLTSEHLHSRLLASDEVRNFRDLIQVHFDEIRIVCYIRPQIDMCVSLYSTMLKNGYRGSFEKHLNLCQPSNYYYDYQALLQRWMLHFPDSEIIVRRYHEPEDSRSLASRFIADVFDGSETVMVEEDRSANRSLSTCGESVLRVVNSTFADDPDIRQKLANIIATHLHGKSSHLSAEQWWRHQREFDGCNEWVRQRFFPSSTELFSEVPPTSRERSFTEREVATLASELVSAFG